MTASPGPILPTLARHVSLHIIGNQGLILDARRQTLHAANGPDTLLLCCLVEGMSHDDMIEALNQRLDLTREEAGRRLEMALSVWRDAALLDGCDDDGATTTADDTDTVAAQHVPEAAMSMIVSEAADGAPGSTIRLLDTDFAITIADTAIAEACAGVLSRLAPDRIATRRVDLTVSRTRQDFVLASGARPLGSCSALEQVPLLLLSTASRIAADRSDALLAVHAGAVRIGAGCALLVGPAGTGKSTLVAGLAANGYDALCDDTVLLSNDTLDIQPLRTGVWIKRGSWPVVGPLFTGHSCGGERLRPDGQHVRLLPIDTALSAAPDGDRLPARRIVFPCFDASAQPSIDQLDPAEALKNLSAHVYLLGRRLDTGLIECLVEWISSIPCYRIRYPSLDSAVDQFRSLTR